VIVSLFGVLTGAVLLYFTLNIPVDQKANFQIMLMTTALFIPFSSANVISTVYDITLPEVRSTALAVQYFIEQGGAALAPLLAGTLTARLFGTLEPSIMIICITAWLLGAVFLSVTAYLVPVDIQTLRDQMRRRADREREMQAGAT
jgi:hypothetical protein